MTLLERIRFFLRTSFFVALLGSVLTVTPMVNAKSKSKNEVFEKNKQGPVKSKCSPRELERKDCRLTLEGQEIRLLNTSITWHNGTWQSVDKVPLVGENVVWEKVLFSKYGEHHLLELWLWDEGHGESKVQSLHWHVLGHGRDQLSNLAQGIVRKRREKEVDKNAEDQPAASDTTKLAVQAKKKSFIYEQMENHGLKIKKGSPHLHWHLGPSEKQLH